MKKFLLYITISFAITNASHAQITKGTVLTGINLGIASAQSEASTPYDFKYTSLLVSPTIGFVIKDNTMLGLSVSYGQYNQEDVNSETESDYYSAMAYYRRYVAVGKRFFLFGQADAGYGLMKRENTSVDEKVNKRESSLSLNLSPGLTYALTKRFQLETGIGNVLGVSYRRDKERTEFSTGEYTSQGSGVSFYANADPRSQLYIGFRLAF